MRLGQARINFDGLTIDGPAGSYTIEPLVMEVLKFLVAHSNQVVLRNDLIDEIWGVGYGGDERLSRAISLLRKALGDNRGNHKYIQTIPRRGYKLLISIEENDSSIKAPIAEIIDSPQEKVSKSPQGRAAVRINNKIASILRPSKKIILVPMVLFIIGAVGLFLLDRPTSNLQKPLTVATGLENVLNFTRPGAIEEAQKVFSTILAENPNHAAARAGLAFALIRENTYLERDPYLLNRAHSAAEAAYRIDGNLALANIAVGWSSEFRGEFDKALKFYDRADILDPYNVLTIEGRVRTLLKQGQNAKAREVVNDGHIKHPTYPHFYSLTGLIEIRENNLKSAETALIELIHLSEGTNSRAYAQLAQVLHLQGKTQEAIKIIQDGLEIHENSRLYNNLGTYLFFQGQYEMAANAFEKTLEYTGDNHDYLHWANLGDSYRYVPGKKKQAYEAYETAIRHITVIIDNRPNDFTLISRSILYHARSGKLESAHDLLTTLPLHNKPTPADFFRLAVIYELLSHRDQALENLKTSLSLGYTKTEVMNEPDLMALRQDLKFQQFITNMENNDEQSR